MVNPLDKAAKKRIVDAIVEAERATSGEIRVHVKSKCGEKPMEEAQKIFRRLRMHRTKHKNGVLVFVAWESRRFAVVGDEGIHQKVGDPFWNETRDKMTRHFSENDIPGGIVAGVQSIGKKLEAHFPAKAGDKNDLSNSVSEGK